MFIAKDKHLGLFLTLISCFALGVLARAEKQNVIQKESAGPLPATSVNVKKGATEMPKFQPPYLGAAYYPEDWPLEQIDEDIVLMKQAGINVARIGEFAWSRMEPVEGHYDLSWLHLVVDKLGQAGIATILGTPSCTPPAWLSERYPEIVVVTDRGDRVQHGSRRHACPNSPIYRKHCARIVTKMAKEFGNDENVIGWQIDNELYWYGARGCCCPVCQKKFQDRLRDKFKTINKLNEVWGTDLWSQTYQSFTQIHAPRSDVWHHPSLLTEWFMFQSDSFVDFAHQQADILHKLAKQPVGTDMMPTNGLSHYAMNVKLDVVQFNHYNDMHNLWEVPFWMDWCRPLKDRPFWNTETATCWNGSASSNAYNEKGFCVVNSWLPIALGGEANLYWLWRAHWSGQELMHGCVVSSAGRPLHIFGEVQQIAKGLAASADFLNGTKVKKSGVALHFSNHSWNFFPFQNLIHGFDYRERLMSCFYRPLNELQLRPDVIDQAADLASYKVIVSPFVVALDEGKLRERILKWVEEGGIWIAGPHTDIRTLDATKFKSAPFGSLETWAGAYCKYEVPASRTFKFKWTDGTESSGTNWNYGFELKGGEALATYKDYPLEGLAAVVRKRIGKGQIILLGTIPNGEDLKKLLLKAASEHYIKPVAEAPANLLVVAREGDAGEGIIVLELENKAATMKLEKRATDLITGQSFPRGDLAVAPYSVMVLKY